MYLNYNAYKSEPEVYKQGANCAPSKKNCSTKRILINLLLPLIFKEDPTSQPPNDRIRILFNNNNYLVEITKRFIINNHDDDSGLSRRTLLIMPRACQDDLGQEFFTSLPTLNVIVEHYIRA